MRILLVASSILLTAALAAGCDTSSENGASSGTGGAPPGSSGGGAAGAGGSGEAGAGGAAGDAVVAGGGNAGEAGAAGAGGEAGAGGSSGTAGTGGTSGAAGTGSPGGAAGTAGAAGDAGAAGAAGASGAAGAGGASACGDQGPSTNPVCEQCQVTNCCAELSACALGTDCRSLSDCLIACSPSDPDCPQACAAQYPGGMKPYEDNFNCAYTKCNLECVTLQCGPFTSNATPCSNCEFANCCSELAQCSVGTDCYSLYTCSNACPSNDASCQQACSTQFPGGLAGYGAILKCSDSKCGKECNGGQCGSFPSGDATCDACMETSCCSQQLACDTGSACSSFAACAKACSDGDQACYGSCRAQFPTGIDPYAINVACSHIHCSTQCKPLAIDAVCSTGISTGKQSCDVCLTANCCSEFKACSGELDPTSGLPKDSARWDACVSCIFKGMPPSDSQFTCESLMSPAATTCLNTHCSQDCM